MYQKGFTGIFYKFSEWFTKIIYLNILWVFFSLLGLLTFGFFPATIALFSVIRLILIKEEEFPVFKTFWYYFKKEFLKGNGIGWGIVMILTIFYFNIQFFRTTENEILQFFYYPMLILAFLFCMTVLYFIPTYVHYNLRFLHTIKNSFLIMIFNPLNTFTMISSIFVIGFPSMMFPTIIPFISISLIVLFIMMAALRSYKRIEDIKELHKPDLNV